MDAFGVILYTPELLEVIAAQRPPDAPTKRLVSAENRQMNDATNEENFTVNRTIIFREEILRCPIAIGRKLVPLTGLFLRSPQ